MTQISAEYRQSILNALMDARVRGVKTHDVQGLSGGTLMELSGLPPLEAARGVNQLEAEGLIKRSDVGEISIFDLSTEGLSLFHT